MKNYVWAWVPLFFISLKTFAGVAVAPVQLFIENPEKQTSTTLTVESVDETDKRIFEVQVFKWTQNEQGENILEPDNNIVVNPKNFILQPNKKQAIRVGFTDLTAAHIKTDEEQTWRIVIDEITPIVKATAVKFLLNFNIPLFLGKQDDPNIKFDIKDNILMLNNQGKSHVKVTNLKLLDNLQKEVFKSDDMFYILPNKKYFHNLNKSNLSNLKKYSVVLETNKNDKDIELKLSN